MFSGLYSLIRENRAVQLITGLFLLLTAWWITIFYRGLVEQPENVYFVFLYPVLSLIGGIAGLYFSKKWGGYKSVLGRAILMFALGLLAQFIGQLLYNYYTFVMGVEVPYPSLGDASYLVSVLFYILGSYWLAKVAGIKFSLGTIKQKLIAVLIPTLVLLLSYFVLLKDYEVDLADPLLLFFDFGFPIGQVIYVSIALLTLLVTKNVLGGLMRRPILLLIAALVMQYIADFTFSYQFSRETIYYGGFTDYLYFFSYFLMTLSLFSIGNMFYKVQES